LTEDEIVMRGEAAALYLNDPYFTSFIAEMKTDTLTCIGNTQPEDEAERTRLYYLHRGICEFVNTLVAYEQAAREINDRSEREQEALKADPLDNY
jgi:hypothetical protein